MAEFKVKKTGDTAVTVLPDYFIKNYMPTANGEFVKVYIYLLFCLKDENCSLSISSLADRFQCAENDIKRALKYWQKAGLLMLEFDASKNLSCIVLTDRTEKPKTEAVPVTPKTVTVKAPEKRDYSPAELSVFQKNAEVRQLLFVCEQYIGKNLTATDMQTLLYFYDELHFSTDLIEYLVEYSVSKGKRSLRYMESIALSWHAKGIRSVEEAKEDSKAYSKNCYLVLKALGANNHDPLPLEVEYVDCWTKTMGMSMDLVLEACRRTIAQIHKPEFKYADKILKDWNKAGVHHMADIGALDQKHQEKAAGSKQDKQDKAFTTRLHDFDQRTYDFDELDNKLFIN